MTTVDVAVADAVVAVVAAVVDAVVAVVWPVDCNRVVTGEI